MDPATLPPRPSQHVLWYWVYFDSCFVILRLFKTLLGPTSWFVAFDPVLSTAGHTVLPLLLLPHLLLLLFLLSSKGWGVLALSWAFSSSAPRP